MSGAHVIGVDVGTGSARAGVFDLEGQLLGTAKQDITVFHGDGHRVEQCSTEIWAAVCTATRGAVAAAGIDPATVAGIGFDATCSLVVLGPGGAPLPVSPGGAPARDIIVWMDHRALDQAARINAGGHGVLRYVGGVISPEMQTPKLLWLKEQNPDSYGRAWQFLDLTDFLTWRATGSLARSICTVTCKWTYVLKDGGWSAGFFRDVGLGDLAEDGFARIGTEIVDAGTALGAGLTPEAAADMGLPVGTCVAAGLIDAHAGGLGTVGAPGATSEKRMAYVFGTSSCTMTTTRDPVFVPGVWGPYFSAMVPGMWLNEGGQSAAGAAIAHLLRHHPASLEATAAAKANGLSLPDWLARRAMAGGDTPEVILRRAARLHVVPEFLGNRAPFADPMTRAVVAGLGMEDSIDSLVDLYLAGLLGLAYGLRQIIETQARAGAMIESIVISGGAGRSDLVRQILADATGIPVEAPQTEEPVLLGSAILGAMAAGLFPDGGSAMATMSSCARRHDPAPDTAQWHARRFDLFERFQALAREAARDA
ncbi:FGGY-family pentulose kinase [Roseicyclus mahoneyensis]|uniref:FGGY-family pentulose kinase n=1 Tax=Roseicyclus mahoneyensis TaxID=164332 RepID=A0A316GKN4_9RHOB|nr:FGGY-family carbohydrate kinase [Roseicyclus mahoneyensis]PWK59976.1 FGGY-family pentulose kinase [Roseicyclus mahoneyensis]